MPDDFYIALRLSGGDLLKWCRKYGDCRALDLKDVPVKLMYAWFAKREALRQLDLQEKAMLNGMTGGFGMKEEDRKANVDLHQRLMREAGFLTPLVPEMAAYLKTHKANRLRYAARASHMLTMPDGTQMSFADCRVWALRQKCLAAVRHLATGARLA